MMPQSTDLEFRRVNDFSNPQKAKDFLLQTGIYTKTGRLTKPYKNKK